MDCSNDGWAYYRDKVSTASLDSDLDPSPQDQREEKVRAVLKQHPFLAYAARYWGQHHILAKNLRARDLSANMLLSNDKAGFLYLLYYATHFDSFSAAATYATGLHLSCLLDLSSTKVLLDLTALRQGDGQHQRLTDSFGRTPLWYAAAGGHFDIVTRLLDGGHNASGRAWGPEDGYSCFKWWYPAWARDDYYSKAVEVAAEGGHSETVSRLIKVNLGYGIFNCLTTGIYGGALEAAVFKGHDETTDVILATDPDIHTSTIQAAVYGGNAILLGKLLDRLPDKETSEKKHFWPFMKSAQSFALYAAALAGRRGLVQFLLARGADVKPKPKGFILLLLQQHVHMDI
jgi:hypothetical protein